MSCPKNIKRFLWINFNGPCSYEDIHVQVSTGNRFHVSKKCSKCGSIDADYFVKPQAMISSGYDIEKLNQMYFYDTFGKSASELKVEQPERDK